MDKEQLSLWSSYNNNEAKQYVVCYVFLLEYTLHKKYIVVVDKAFDTFWHALSDTPVYIYRRKVLLMSTWHVVCHTHLIYLFLCICYGSLLSFSLLPLTSLHLFTPSILVMSLLSGHRGSLLQPLGRIQHPSIYPPICPSIHPSLYLSIHPSIGEQSGNLRLTAEFSPPFVVMSGHCTALPAEKGKIMA